MAAATRLSSVLRRFDFYFSFRRKYSHLKLPKGKKNVLVILPQIAVGGAEKSSLTIAQGVNNEKYSFHIITERPSDILLRKKFETYFQNVITPLGKTEKTRYYHKIDYKCLQYLIKKLDIALVLIPLPRFGHENVPRLKSEFPQLSIVDMVHSVESYKLDDIVERTTPSIDRRICISQKVRRYLAESYEKKFDSAETYIRRLNVIYNGIDEKEFTPNAMRKGKFKARFSIPENEKIISFIGRFSYEKQPILFVDIAQNLLSKSKHKLKFVMAGDGLDSEKVKNRIKEHGLEDYFILTGMIDYTAELLNDTDIFLVVSEYEGIPNAMLEAMSLGVPVISTDVGAISEVVENNVNGFLINPSNSSSNVIQSFTDTILELLRDQTKRSAVSGKAIETINQRFTLETMATNYERLFNELTKNYLDSSV